MSGSFERELEAFLEKTRKNYEKVRRMSAFDLFSSVVMQTPVDKGVLRGNWFASVGSATSSTSANQDPSGSSTIARIQYVLNGVTISNDIYLSNNLPYGPRIEYDGWSGKAPAGMVRINVARWDSIVANNLQKVRRGV